MSHSYSERPNYYCAKHYLDNADGTVNINGGPRDGMIRTVDDMKWLNAMVGAGYKFYPRQNVSKSGTWHGIYN